jgi:fructose 1,6-bisphosphatase
MVSIQITNGKYCKSGQMICKKCNEKIGEEDYLIEEHYISKRGNEDDYNLNFHRKCSEDKNKKCKDAWDVFDKSIEVYRQELIKNDNYKKAKKLLKSNYKYVELVLNAKLV